jgi:hypothetical protein
VDPSFAYAAAGLAPVFGLSDLATRSRCPSQMRIIAIGNAGQNDSGCCGDTTCDGGSSTSGNSTRWGGFVVLRAELLSRTGRRRAVNWVTFFVEPLVRSFLPFRISDSLFVAPVGQQHRVC